jgi:hypothetical protein
MTTNAMQIFNFLRGAIRSTWGIEDFRGKRIAIMGMSSVGQQLLALLCFDEVDLLFHAENVVNYNAAYSLCRYATSLSPGEPEAIDIMVDLISDCVVVIKDSKMKSFKISDIGEDPYNQGIHEFYL